MDICTAYACIAELAEALGVQNVNRMVGCWEYQIDDHWGISLNGHSESTLDSYGVDIPPFTFSIRHNGFMFGLINPTRGTVMHYVEADFINAVQAKIKHYAVLKQQTQNTGRSKGAIH